MIAAFVTMPINWNLSSYLSTSSGCRLLLRRATGKSPAPFQRKWNRLFQFGDLRCILGNKWMFEMLLRTFLVTCLLFFILPLPTYRRRYLVWSDLVLPISYSYFRLTRVFSAKHHWTAPTVARAGLICIFHPTRFAPAKRRRRLSLETTQTGSSCVEDLQLVLLGGFWLTN